MPELWVVCIYAVNCIYVHTDFKHPFAGAGGTSIADASKAAAQVLSITAEDLCYIFGSKSDGTGKP
jgi:hypothetical protein